MNDIRIKNSVWIKVVNPNHDHQELLLVELFFNLFVQLL
jgi:hypothetical protein